MNRLLQTLNPLLTRLGSMSLAIVILMVLSIASVIGTVLLQNQDQTDYQHQFGPLWYWVFRALGLFDMYHTWWFLALLGLLMLSLAACLLRHAPRMLKEMRLGKVAIADKSLHAFHHLRLWRVARPADAALQADLAAQFDGWETQMAAEEGKLFVRADKGRRHKWGYILVHVAILVILIGGWISVQFGFRGNMSVVEGSTGDTISYLKGTGSEEKKMPFTVRCNSFSIDFYPTGMPKEFRSNLTIIDEGKEVLTSDIVVNEPLNYKGVNIYQASFGDGGSEMRFKLFRLDGSGAVESVPIHVYDTWTDPKSNVSIEVTDFRPFNVEKIEGKFHDLGPAVDFVVRGPGLTPVKMRTFMNPFDLGGANQGMLAMVSTTGDARDFEVFYLGLDFTAPKEWQLFSDFARRIRANGATDDKDRNLAAFKGALTATYGDERPTDLKMLAMRQMQGVQSLSALPWPFIPILDSFEQKYYTGLQLAQDPGMNVVWFGSALLCIGLCIMFYMPHRKLWLVIASDEGGAKVAFGGSTNRNKLGFEAEFNDILARIEKQLGENSTSKEAS